MIVKAIYKDENHDYFRDVQTKAKRVYGDIFECDDKIAEERIKKGLVKKTTKKEEKEYYDSIDTNDDSDIKEKWTVTQEIDGNVHVRPVVNEKIVDTPVEQILKPEE